MKRIIHTVVLAACVSCAQSAWSEDSFETQQKVYNLKPMSTYADRQANVHEKNQWAGTSSAFPADGDAVHSLPVHDTFADRKTADARIASAPSE